MSDEPDRPDASHGWTLRQALERTADPRAWQTWRSAMEAFEKIKVPIGTALGGFVLPSPQKVNDCRQAASVAYKQLVTDFRTLLSSGAMMAVGSRGARSIPPTPIYSEGWPSLRIVNLDRSIVQERGGSGMAIYNVRIFPFVHAADAPARLSGSSLAVAFKKCILQDPEIIAASRRIPDLQRYDSVFREGQFPGLMIDYKWPLDLTASNLTFQFVRPPILIAGMDLPRASPQIAWVAELMVDRLQRLRQRLIDGELLARGMNMRIGVVQYVDPLQWARRSLYVDSDNGDVLESQEHKMVLMWSGLSLLHGLATPMGVVPFPAGLPEAMQGNRGSAEFHVEPLAPYELLPTTMEAQSPPKNAAITRVETRQSAEQECTDWLVSIMETSKDKRTESNEALLKHARERWGTSLSARAFARARARAVEIAKATAWSAAGAPKKSPHRNPRTS